MIFLSDFTPPFPFVIRLYQILFDRLLTLALQFLKIFFVNVQVPFSVRV